MSINIKVKPDTEVKKATFTTVGKKIDNDDDEINAKAKMIKQELEFEKKNKSNSTYFDIAFLGGKFPLFSMSSKQKRE
ncbi:20727_t:CDS:2, partial [Racocetra persica]